MSGKEGKEKKKSSDSKSEDLTFTWDKVNLRSVLTSLTSSQRERYGELLGEPLSDEDKKRIGQLKKKCRKAARDLEEQTKKNKNVLIFFGNGVSEDHEESHPHEPILSTKDIHYAYLRDMANTNPRRYQDRMEAIEGLSEAFSERSGDYDMLGFMKDLAEVEDVKRGFADYVTRTCCTAAPNRNHDYILTLFYLLSGSPWSLQLVHFTTNYDNLVEKAYHHSRRHVVRLDYFRLMKEKSVEMKEPDPPVYVLDDDGISRHAFPIVPLHGSVRVCVCPQCNRILETQAAAMGEKRCVYCGRDIPSVVLPTSEGEADKRLLRILERRASEAAAILFIGYGFGDPHIMDRIKRGLASAKGSSSKTIINISHSILKATKIDATTKMVHNLKGDITEVLGILVGAIGDRKLQAEAK